MVKFGRAIYTIHQICYNHALYLLLIYVLFQKPNDIVGDNDVDENNDDSDDNGSDNED